LRTEGLSRKSPFFVDSSFHFTRESANAGEEASQTYLADSDLRIGPQRTESAAPGLRHLDLAVGRPMPDPYSRGLSPWTRSRAKRIFDCMCVLLASPVVVPFVLAIGAAVRLTSRGPVLFLQERMGMNYQTFTIFKFRTMHHVSGEARQFITSVHNQRFTPIGAFLRRWKLDELPQLANVLLGHASLVGPRPKMPEFVPCKLPCRPGLTGVATIAFAREAAILARVPREWLGGYYHQVVLPAKQEMDAEYLAQATLLSDLGLIIKTSLLRWNPAPAEKFIAAAELEFLSRSLQPMSIDSPSTFVRMPMPIPAMASHATAVERAAAVQAWMPQDAAVVEFHAPLSIFADR
jgi:lipopolysaccharide/colanic/teichoic acid biosynthesis glycosyltransferase